MAPMFFLSPSREKTLSLAAALLLHVGLLFFLVSYHDNHLQGSNHAQQPVIALEVAYYIDMPPVPPQTPEPENHVSNIAPPQKDVPAFIDPAADPVVETADNAVFTETASTKKPPALSPRAVRSLSPLARPMTKPSPEQQRALPPVPPHTDRSAAYAPPPKAQHRPTQKYPRLKAQYAYTPPPHYPKRARKRKLQGTVLLWVAIDPRGTVLDLGVQSSSGHAVLDRAALNSVKVWRFHPAHINGKPVAEKVFIPVKFELNGITVVEMS